jgi:hypothetical protein
MDGHYPDEFAKIALALTSAQLAKQMFVEESGVGEDLAFNFIGWKDGRLLTITQMGKKFMKEPPVDRLQRCASMLRMIRGFWNVDSITMVAEGYCSPDIEKTRGLDLAKAFLDEKNEVSECVTITHAEQDDEGGAEITLVSTSYKYRLNRRAVFEPITVYPNGAVNVLRDKSYPALLYKTVSEDYVVEEMEEEDAAEAINNLGFHLQVFY